MKKPIADVILAYRSKKDISQWDLGFQCGVSPQILSNLERGKSEPSFENLVKLGRIIPINLAEIELVCEGKDGQTT